MMMKTFITTAALVALVAPAMGMEWSTDLEAAKAQSVSSGKCIMLHFTGSDWCGHCIRQRADVFAKPEFKQFVKQNLIPVEVDVPSQRVPMSAEQRNKNENLCKEFSISAFPTILVLNPGGVVVGGYSGNAGEPAYAIHQLQAGIQNADYLKKIETLSGAERLNALADVYNSIPKKMRSKAKELREQIIALDAEDSTGLQAEVRAEEQMSALMQELHGAAPTQHMAIIDAYMQKAEPANKMAIVQIKMNAMLMQAETVEDILNVAQFVEQYAAGDSRMMLTVKQLREQSEAVLKRLKQMRVRGGASGR